MPSGLLIVAFAVVAFKVSSESGEYDYVVAGAGSAGSAVAAKLAAAGKSVLLLEAGPDDDWKGKDVAGNAVDPYNPEDYSNLQYTPDIDDAVMSEPTWQIGRSRDPRLANLTDLTSVLSKFKEFMPRAKMVGGCSMHNFMFFYRGSPDIYNSWGRNWSWDVLLPKFRDFENDLRPGIDPAFHGTSGENRVSTREPWMTEAGRLFLKAAEKAGHRYNNDFNGASLLGVGPSPTSTFDGRRWSSSKAYLTPAIRVLPNFHLVTGATVTQVIFDGRRAVGVAYTKEGRARVASVAHEIILSLGSFRSPQLLMLSGVGPPEVLQEFGIQIIAESKGVGANLQDHLMVFVDAAVPPALNKSNSSYAPSGGYFFSSWCKERKCTHPDLELMCGSGSVRGAQAIHSCMVGLVGSIQSQPGFVTLTSKDIARYPAIFPNYLGASADIERLVEGVRETCRIYSEDPYTFSPSPLCASNVTRQMLEEYVMSAATTIYHPVGTCKLGLKSDPMAVVDPTLKVYGVEGLRVADASVMPLITNVNTDAPSRMIGYHLADMILEELHETLQDRSVVV